MAIGIISKISILVLLVSLASVRVKSHTSFDLYTAIKQYMTNLENANSLAHFQAEALLFSRRNFAEFMLDNSSTFDNISQECSKDVTQLMDGLKNDSEWALTVVDSFGKPPSGILAGALIWPGDYNECLSINELADTDWNSKYCSLESFLSNRSTNYQSQHLQFKYGSCMPKTCTESDIAAIFNQRNTYWQQLFLYHDIQFKSNDVVCHYAKEFDYSSKVAIILFGSYALLVLIGTLYDLVKLYIRRIVFERESRTITFQFTDDSVNLNEETQNLINSITEQTFFSDESTFSKFMSNFSIYSNSIIVFKDSTETSRLRCLHAIRVLSLAWVVLGHTYGFIIMFSDNVKETQTMMRRFFFALINNAWFSVDNFFLISGLLTSYKFIRELNKPNAKFTFGFMVKYYLHRLWRIMPTYVTVMTLTVLLSKYLGQGPFFPLNGFEPQENCRNYWWMNILFINNFLKREDMCFSISWYLANDMQFHWLAPIIIIPFAFKKRIIGTIIGSLFLIGSILAILLILLSNPNAELGNYGDNSEVFIDMIYTKPWARIGPFIIGIFLGCIILHQDQITIKPKFRILIWILSLVICSLCVFGLYPDFQNFPTVYYGKEFHIFYQSISRVIWAVGVSCVIFACGISKGKLINKILTLRFWIPLSRLTFSAYLIHCTVIFYFYTTQDRAMHVQDINMIYYYLGNLMFSYGLAFIVSTCIELPFIGLEKLFFNKKNS